jgi:ABC-2 type transport system ATP-binding protein
MTTIPQSAPAALITISALTKAYEPTPGWMRPFVRTHIREPIQALRGIDMVVHEGEICAIVGPNGAGKTTLFRIIVGLTTPTSGTGTVAGFDVEHEPEKVRQVVGWMPAEDRSLLMRATCRENLWLHGRLQGMRVRDLATRIEEILAVVDLEGQRNSIVASLSSGMKARLRLARALLPEPSVLILDEPTGAIDPIAAHSLLALITDLARDRGLAVLLSSHRLEEIEALQSHALLLDHGTVRFAGDLEALRNQLSEPLLEITFSNVAIAERAAARVTAAGAEVWTEDATVHCRLSGRAAVGELLSEMSDVERHEIRMIREVPTPLRDLIAHIYSNEATGHRRAS